jgi:predicted MFS family arabinose efflux permease
MSIKELSERPPKVVLAIKLLYLVVGIGMIRAVMTVLRHADVRSPYFFILTKLFIYTGSLFLIYQLGKCKNWAKVSLVVILAVSIPLTILPALYVTGTFPSDRWRAGERARRDR